MSIAEGNQPVVGQSDLPTWDERYQFFKMRRWFRFLVAVIVILWIQLIIWVLFLAPISDAAIAPMDVLGDLSPLVGILAPILLVGLFVERLLETCFNILESGWRTMVAYLGRGMRWLKIAEFEVMAARRWMVDVSANYSREIDAVNLDATRSLVKLTKALGPKVSAANELRQMAEKRLIHAEDQLVTLIKFDHYKSAKTTATLMIGLMVGLIVATLGQLQIFALLGIGLVPARSDVLISGLIMGASAQPIHTVITRLGVLVDRIGASSLKKLNIDLDKT